MSEPITIYECPECGSFAIEADDVCCMQDGEPDDHPDWIALKAVRVFIEDDVFQIWRALRNEMRTGDEDATMAFSAHAMRTFPTPEEWKT